MQRHEFLKKYQIIVKMWYKIPTHNNINNIKNKEARTDVTEIIITQQLHKQTSKKTNNRNRPYNKQMCICIVLIQGNENSLMKFAAVSGTKLKTRKCLQKISFSIDIMD